MFVPVQNRRIYQQVAEQIQDMILDGTLKSGGKLPSERTMAEQFGVSRNSIREAIRALEILGIVESRQGGGNFIVAGNSDCLFEPLSIMFKLHNTTFADLLEIRRGLEMEAATLAAKQKKTVKHRELAATMKALSTAGNEERSIELDKKLHLLIAELSGNIMLSGFLHAISRLLEQAVRDGRKLILSSCRNNEKLIKIHQELCDAIIAGKPKVAAKISRKHFDFILENLKD
jgi:GntR family transcriptional repressor for pyruvate dehydrogenase complex